MKVFSVAEVVDMGIEKEKKRRDFYAAVADCFSEKELKDLFGRLRDWEEEHVAKFSEIRGGLDEQDPVESYPGELIGYMQALVEDRLYSEVTAGSLREKIKTPLDAVMQAIGFEKDALLFFQAMKELVNSTRHREVIDELVGEEKKHIIYLSQLGRKISGK